jgi:hypothetical protein
MMWMPFNLVLLLLAPLTLSHAAMPSLEAETLTGEKVRLPELWLGQPAVVVWSFSRVAGEGIKAWMAALEREGVNAWGAAVLEKAPRFVRPMIRREMRGDIPKQFHSRTICFYRGDKELRETLGVGDDRLPLVVMLGANGAIVWKHSGLYEEAARSELMDRWRRLF